MPVILFAALATFIPPAIGFITVFFVGSNISSSYSNTMSLLLLSSVTSFLVGFCILGSILLVTKLSRGNRTLLLFTFKPMLKFTQFATVLLVASHAYTVTVSTYFLEAYYIGRVHFFLIGIIGLIAGWTSLKILWFSLTRFKEAETKVLGKVVIKSEQPKLWQLVEEVCEKTGSEVPKNIVLGLSPNFFVTESHVSTWDENLSGKTLYLSLPFTRLLKSDELKAIIAHEMGHFIGKDTQFSRSFYPIYRGAQNTISLLSKQLGGNSNEGSLSGLALLPSLAINSFFFEQFSKLENEIGRERELAADRVSADAFSAKSIATALVKAHAYGAVWSVNEETMLDALSNGKEISNSSIFFEAFVKTLDMDKVNEFLGKFQTEHPTDTHPPLDVRLKALNFKLTVDELKRIQDEGESDIVDLISEISLLEEELTKHENNKLIAISQLISQAKRKQKASIAKEKKEEHLYLFNELLRKMLILTAMIDGKIVESEKEGLSKIYNRITGDILDQHDLIADINSFNDWSEMLFEMVEKSKFALQKELKILLIRAVLLVAISDGEFANEEKSLVSDFTEKLGLSIYDLKKLMEEMFSGEDGTNVEESA